MPALLELHDVEARYGAVKALHGVSLVAEEKQIVAVLGANGAGKTTTLRAISNTVRRSGEVQFAGKSLARRSPESIVRMGIAHVPEGRGTFSELTVNENLRLGATTRRGGIKDDLKRVREFFPWIERRAEYQTGTLSCGAQTLLALRSRQGPLGAVSRRCSGWRARSWRGLACCSSTSLRSASRR